MFKSREHMERALAIYILICIHVFEIYIICTDLFCLTLYRFNDTIEP